MDQIANNKDQLKKINIQLKSAITVYEKFRYLQKCKKGGQFQVCVIKSMKIITQYLKESLKYIQANEELVDKIFILLLRMNLNDEILRESEMGNLLIKIKEKKLLENQRYNISDQLQQKWRTKKEYESKRQIRREKVKRNQSSSSNDSSNKKKKIKKKNVKYKYKQQQNCQICKRQYSYELQIFQKDDEPNQRGMTIEEVIIFQKQQAGELKRLKNGYDIKHRESMMEGQEHKLQLDNIQHMIEQIPFIKPIKLRLNYSESYETNFKEIQKQQKRTEYNRDIPEQPGYNEISNTQFVIQQKIIHLDPPKREDLMFMVQIICNRGFTELEEKHKNINKKQIKGILKKPQEEQSQQKKDVLLNQAKQDLQPKMNQLVQMIIQKQNHSQESILSLLHDIIQKLKEIGEEQYIKNFKSFLETKLNDQQTIISEQERIKSQQEQQRNRFEQLQNINPTQAQRLRAYKTKHCHNYHSPIGCTRGDNCNFIHDSCFPGRSAPIPQYPNFLNKSLYPQTSIQLIVSPLLQQLNPAIFFGRKKRTIVYELIFIKKYFQYANLNFNTRINISQIFLFYINYQFKNTLSNFIYHIIKVSIYFQSLQLNSQFNILSSNKLIQTNTNNIINLKINIFQKKSRIFYFITLLKFYCQKPIKQLSKSF
ncbi:unnamed protein product [Paramecium sonneborni]|uniref:C3H1-type domain-containing protein n=1 Tax=Paramecium sonneborni TaxID=65129 RepID=A0A8S1LST3_9CILI|nr:unnamed protein product [Paramecium sonneborni]